MLAFLRDKVKNRRIIILGFGMEGQSTLNFLLNKKSLFPNIIVMDANENIAQHHLIVENHLSCFVGDHYQSNILAQDFVIKSPGVKLSVPFADFQTFSQTSLFLENYSEQIIGITGTKGKSTTSTMMYQVLKDQDKDVYLVGNIGQPAFDLVDEIGKETFIVYELSAHQLQCIKHGPKYAILLNLMPEHLDFFGTTERYYAAKLKIFNNQSKESFSYISPTCMQTAEKIIDCPNNTNYSDLAPDSIFINEDEILTTNDLENLIGQHHIGNNHALVELVIHLELDIEKALKTIKQFHPLPHRQELILKKNGLTVVNDSISTIPQSAIQAIKAIGNIDYLILGGLDRGIDYTVLIDYLANLSLVKVYFLGEAGERIVNELNKKYKLLQFHISTHEKLQDIKNELLKIEKGIVLLSPAAASYDAFTNFEERGNYFRKIFTEKM